MPNVPCTMPNVPCTMPKVPCTMPKVPCTMPNVPQTMPNVPQTMPNVPCRRTPAGTRSTSSRRRCLRRRGHRTRRAPPLPSLWRLSCTRMSTPSRYQPRCGCVASYSTCFLHSFLQYMLLTQLLIVYASYIAS
jgi:hypothetical protein